MTWKKFIYKAGIMLGDFIAFTLLAVFASWYYGNVVPVHLFFTAMILSAIKVLISFIAGNYSLLYMYKIRRSLGRFAAVIYAFDLIALLLSRNAQIDQITGFNMHVYVVLILLEFVYLVASRYLIMDVLTTFYHKKERQKVIKRTLVVGAGDAGVMVYNELSRPEFGTKVVGFLDDSKDKISTMIEGVKVYGPVSEINTIVEKLACDEVIIAMPSVGMAKVKEITNMIDYHNVSVRILPDKTKLLQSNISETIRSVEIADLLGRDQINLDKSKLSEFIAGKTILVTGGGGSIGSEIVRQVLEYNPKQVIIFDIYENTAYELKTELDIKYRAYDNKPNYLVLIGSVRDQNRLEEIFKTYKPNIVFHAAAHKHVPLMEDSPYEAIKNNIKGTYNVAKMADKYKTEKMVLISTDKAVRPTNVMGASKRFCEMVVEAWNAKSKNTHYSMVRFGNVLGSHGSVIPLFESQIRSGGPLTVTSEEITRFFMTIPEACGLVIESGAYAAGGEKFILDMGEPVKIIDLAKNMIKLSGLELGKDIDIKITGLRPGEKLYEELLLKTANATKTQNDKIYVEYSKNPFDLQKIDEIIAHLEEIGHNNQEVLDYLKELEIIKETNN